MPAPDMDGVYGRRRRLCDGHGRRDKWLKRVQLGGGSSAGSGAFQRQLWASSSGGGSREDKHDLCNSAGASAGREQDRDAVGGAV